MSDNPIMGLKEQQRRRRRINRMKSFFVWTIVLWILISMITCIVLSVQIVSLNKRFNKLYDFISSSSGNVVMSEEDFADLTGETKSEGDITIEYNTDSDNQAEVNNEDNVVYLTFDDGPSDYTDDILNILDEYNVKATFFVIGKTDEHSKEMYKRIVDDGHTIALHSYSHKYSKIYASLDAYQQDLDKLSDLVYDTTGVRSKYLRFPGGSSNQVSDVDMSEFIKLVTQEGYTYFDWNVVSGDATGTNYSAKELTDNVISGVEKYKTSIVLMHDSTSKKATVDALPDIIEKLQAEGYKILPIDDNTKVIQHVSVDSVVNN